MSQERIKPAYPLASSRGAGFQGLRIPPPSASVLRPSPPVVARLRSADKPPAGSTPGPSGAQAGYSLRCQATKRGIFLLLAPAPQCCPISKVARVRSQNQKPSGYALRACSRFFLRSFGEHMSEKKLIGVSREWTFLSILGRFSN